MKSYLLSGLRHAYPREEDFSAFARAAGLHWLLWEPGTWTPPAKSRSTRLVDLHAAAAEPKAGEALVLVLAMPPRGDRVTFGRDPACDLNLNDGTLSQAHLVFTRDSKGWAVQDTGSTNGSWVDGQRLVPGQPVLLRNGTRIQAAQVKLTHYEPAGLWVRIQEPRPAGA